MDNPLTAIQYSDTIEILEVNQKKDMTREQKEYLDNLREDGKTNMFGAAVYLAWEFGLEKSEARAILKEWMGSFKVVTN